MPSTVAVKSRPCGRYPRTGTTTAQALSRLGSWSEVFLTLTVITIASRRPGKAQPNSAVPAV